MKTIINIKSKKAIDELKTFKQTLYLSLDIKFENVHLKRINELARKRVFSKNDAYINAVTLYELMKEVGMRGAHNYHGLSPKDIIEALNNLSTPTCIFKTHSKRFVVIPSMISSFEMPLMVVIEKDSGLITNPFANINKIVTIYPKDELENYMLKINKRDIIYIKK